MQLSPKATAFAPELEKIRKATCKKKGKKKPDQFFPLCQEVSLGDPACPRHSTQRQRRCLRDAAHGPGFGKSITTSSQIANKKTSKLQELFKLSFHDGGLSFTCLFLFCIYVLVCNIIRLPITLNWEFNHLTPLIWFKLDLILV